MTADAAAGDGFAGYPVGYIPPPTVDPSKLTTDAVNAAREQWRLDLEAVERLIEARLDGMDKATSLRLMTIAQMPESTALLVKQLSDLHTEKFDSIELQFRERDIRTDQAAIASKQALDAALLAAKELVGQQNSANVEAATKAETNFTKQIDQTSVLISTLEKGLTDRVSSLDSALTDRISELKERLDRGDGGGFRDGSVATRVDARAGHSATGVVISYAIAALSLAVSIVVAIALIVKP